MANCLYNGEKMSGIKDKIRRDSRRATTIMRGIGNPGTQAADVYSVAATLYGEAKDLDDIGVTRVAETIRNRYNFYTKNKADGVDKISYRDIVSAPGQYLGFNAFKNKSITDFKNFENSLSPEDKRKWNRCMIVAQRVVKGQLKTDYALGAMGFNQASVESNKKIFKTTKVFKDDSCYIDDPKRKSPHVFIADFYISPLKNNQGKILAKGGNPNDNIKVLVRNSAIRARRSNG